MRQKERKAMDRPHRLHPVGTTRSPQGCQRHPGVTDRPYNPIREVERFGCLLRLAGRVGEGQLLIVETEESSEEGQESLAIGSLVAREYLATRILRVRSQFSAFREELLLGEHSTMKVVGRVRGGVIVYRRPLW